MSDSKSAAEAKEPLKVGQPATVQGLINYLLTLKPGRKVLGCWLRLEKEKC